MSIAALSEDDAALAGEYALGLLEGAEARGAILRAAEDRSFREAVDEWTEHLAGLADAVSPVPPRPTTRAALERRLFGPPPATGAAGLWRWLTGLAVAASVVLAALYVTELRTPPRPALFVAELQQDGGDLRAVAVVNATAHEIRLTLQGVPADDARDLQLWGIPAGDAPVPIGLLPDRDGTAVLLVPEALFGRAAGLVLAISDEPAGGSPTGAPTGDILVTAPLSGL